MRRGIVAIGTAAVSTLGLVGVVALGFGGSAQAAPTTIRAQLYDTSGEEKGVARLEQQDDGSVLIRVNATGLTRGFHGLHIHTFGKCETTPTVPPAPPVTFDQAGGHFDSPPGANHGFHAGDLPVLLADGSGNAYLRLTTSAFTLADLFDLNGSALIIHAGPDNFGNIPTRYVQQATLAPVTDGTAVTPSGVVGPDGTTLSNGDSGPRFACAVLAAPTTA
jgi:Cu-Zn family superoxide dismutase